VSALWGSGCPKHREPLRGPGVLGLGTEVPKARALETQWVSRAQPPPGRKGTTGADRQSGVVCWAWEPRFPRPGPWRPKGSREPNPIKADGTAASPSGVDVTGSFELVTVALEAPRRVPSRSFVGPCRVARVRHGGRSPLPERHRHLGPLPLRLRSWQGHC
jgi:hypothetical protein